MNLVHELRSVRSLVYNRASIVGSAKLRRDVYLHDAYIRLAMEWVHAS